MTVAIIQIEKIKASVGSEKLAVLADIFERREGVPPGVHAARYRADHPKWMTILERLESEQNFLKRSRTGEKYELRVFVLPLLRVKRAEELVVLMNEIFDKLKTFYNERLSKPVKVKEIVELFPPELSDSIREALYFMTDSHSVWGGGSIDFPYGSDSYTCVPESVLRYEDFYSVLSEFYEWHIVNPKKKAKVYENLLPLNRPSRSNWASLPPTRIHWLLAVLVGLLAIIVPILLNWSQ